MGQVNSVLLASCRSPYLDNAKVYPPLGIMKLQSAIEAWSPDIKVDIVDEYDDNTFLDYDVIGLSVMTPQRDEASRVLSTVKRINPYAKTIIGGPHPRFYFDDVVEQSWDHIVTDDGEYALKQIITDDYAPRVIKDKLEKPAFANLPKINRLKNKEFLKGYKYELKGVDSTTMLTATGCPERCTFCEDSQTPVRWTSLETLASEMDDMVELGYGGVYIFDDIFAIARSKVDPIAQQLKEHGLIYRCNGQARYMNDDFMAMLADTGCAEIAFGAETGSQKILDNINKRTTVEQNYEFMRLTKKYGIDCKPFILLGLPGEDISTLQETEKFIAETQPEDFQCAVYMPFKGTKIRDAIDQGQDIDLEMVVTEVSGAYGIKGGETAYEVRTSRLSPGQLQEFRNYLVNTYRPKSHKNKWEYETDE